MTCVHLQQLYQLCQDHDLKISSGDLVRMVCKQCGEHEVCPSVLTDEYDADVELLSLASVGALLSSV